MLLRTLLMSSFVLSKSDNESQIIARNENQLFRHCYSRRLAI